MLRRSLILVLSVSLAIGPAFAKGGRGGDGGGGGGGGHDGGGPGGGGHDKGGDRGGGPGGGGHDKGGGRGDGPGGGGPGGGHDKGGDSGGGGSASSTGSSAAGTGTAAGGRSGSASGGGADDGSPAGTGGNKGTVGGSGRTAGPEGPSSATAETSGGKPGSSGSAAASGFRKGPAVTGVRTPTAFGAVTGALAGRPVAIAEHGDSRLPASLAPSGRGTYASLGQFRLTALPFRRGTSIATVRACRAAAVEASRPFGAVRVDAAGAGIIRSRPSGTFLAPVEIRIVYARGGRYQVRRADAWCELDAAGRVIAIR